MPVTDQSPVDIRDRGKLCEVQVDPVTAITENPLVASVGDVSLTYETLGDPSDPPVLLVMGLGAQLHAWPPGFCDELVSRGLYLVRFDNRDVGLSTHFSAAGAIDLSTLPGAEVPYTMGDLAADAVGLITAIGLDRAHLVGISMGGMIVQQAAIEHPERVCSLVCIASTTGDRAVGQGRPEALAALFSPPAAPTREAVVARSLEVARVIGSPGFERDEDWLRERAGRAFDRCYDPAGASRQAAAIITAPDRTDALAQLRLPALVVHGREDPLVDISGGLATADAIPDAEFVEVCGMGHDLPRGAWTTIAKAIERTVRRAQRS